MKWITTHYLAAGLAVAIGACTAPPQTTIAAVAVALTAADQAALACIVNKVPACTKNAAAIKASALAAYNAVKAAEKSGAQGDVAEAQATVTKLQAAIPSQGS